MNTIEVLIKEPGKGFRLTEIENSLEALQKAVGGYIETVTVAEDLVIICDEEGRIKHDFNLFIFGIEFYGTIIFAGVDGEEFADIPEAMKDYQKFIVKHRSVTNKKGD